MKALKFAYPVGNEFLSEAQNLNCHYSCVKFQHLNAHQWTSFWKELTTKISQQDRRIREYKWSSIKRRLINVGIDKDIANKVQTTFNGFKEVERQMLRFCQFFISNRDMIQDHLGTSDITNTLLKVLDFFENGDHEVVRKQLEGVRLLRELNRRGEGNWYESSSNSTLDIGAFIPKQLQRKLTRSLNPNKYEAISPIEYRGWTVFPFFKETEFGQPLYIFMQLQKKSDGTLAAKISASDIEQIIIRSQLAKVFGSYLRSIEVEGNFQKLMKFIQHDSGESNHFLLKSTGFADGDFIISVKRKFASKRSTALGSPYVLKKLKHTDQLDSMVLKHRENKLVQRPIPITVSTFRNARVIGAIILNFRDRNFRALQRESIRRQFEEDFGMPLGAFIRYQEPSEKELCQLFLENEARRKTAHLGVRLESANKAWDLYGKIVELGIIKPDFEEKIITSYCFNRGCNIRYKPQQRTRSFCEECGFTLCDKNDITINSISEAGIVRWLQKRAKEFQFDTARFISRKVLGRKVFILEIEKGNDKIHFMPVTSDPSPHFLEVISARYPDVCVITSKDNVSEFSLVKIQAVQLYDFFHELEVQKKQVITRNSRKIKQNVKNRISQRAEDAADHLQNDDYYLQKNAIAKNLGAELLEADSHALLQCMLGFSVWLGAKSRGQAVPDGRSAFPFFPSLNIDQGCFAWDAKFTIDTRSKIGGPSKNQEYVRQLYSDPSMRKKASRGLVFISNKPEQLTFRSVARAIVRKKRVKVVYMKVSHLIRIYQYFLEYWQKIENDERAKKSFYLFLKNLLTSTSSQNGGKVLILDDNFLNTKLTENKHELDELEPPSI